MKLALFLFVCLFVYLSFCFVLFFFFFCSRDKNSKRFVTFFSFLMATSQYKTCLTVFFLFDFTSLSSFTLFSSLSLSIAVIEEGVLASECSFPGAFFLSLGSHSTLATPAKRRDCFKACKLSTAFALCGVTSPFSLVFLGFFFCFFYFGGGGENRKFKAITKTLPVSFANICSLSFSTINSSTFFVSLSTSSAVGKQRLDLYLWCQ